MKNNDDLERNLQLARDWSPTFKIMGDETRLKLLSAIHFAGPYALTVTELADTTDVKVPTASAALRAMEANGTVHSAREGRSIRYAIQDDNVHRLLHEIGTTHAHE